MHGEMPLGRRWAPTADRRPEEYHMASIGVTVANEPGPPMTRENTAVAKRNGIQYVDFALRVTVYTTYQCVERGSGGRAASRPPRFAEP